jgi:ABC-2 type transport system permease protein
MSISTALGLRPDHVSLIARTYAKHSIRGGSGLMFTFATLIIGLAIASIVVSLAEDLRRDKIKDGADARSVAVIGAITDKYSKPVVKWAIGADDEQAEYLVDEKPGLISAILIIMLMAVPFLASFGAYNQLSGDIHNKGLRYVLLRTERVNIIVGRFIGTYLFTVAVLGILMAIILLYMVGKGGLYPRGAMALWIAQGALAMVVLALPYVAFCTWLSASIDSPVLSFFVTQAVVGFLPLVAFFGDRIVPGVKVVGYAMPWPLRYYLIHPNPAWVVGAAVVMLAFTAVFLALGIRHFQKRDL